MAFSAKLLLSEHSNQELYYMFSQRGKHSEDRSAYV